MLDTSNVKQKFGNKFNTAVLKYECLAYTILTSGHHMKLALAIKQTVRNQCVQLYFPSAD